MPMNKVVHAAQRAAFSAAIDVAINAVRGKGTEKLSENAVKLVNLAEPLLKDRYPASAFDAARKFVSDPNGKWMQYAYRAINEIDPQLRCADFRIALFQREHRGRGIGSWAVRTTRDFAFGTLGLHRLSLDVFSFNPRAERAYLAAGFRREGVLRDAVRDGEGYGDDILMALLEEEWRTLPDRQPS